MWLLLSGILGTLGDLLREWAWACEQRALPPRPWLTSPSRLPEAQWQDVTVVEDGSPHRCPYCQEVAIMVKAPEYRRLNDDVSVPVYTCVWGHVWPFLVVP